MEQYDKNTNEEFSLSFRINNGVPINTKELELFNSNFSGNNASCQVSNLDGSSMLSYTVPATLSLEQFLRKKLYRGEVFAILSNMLDQLLFFDSNGMPLKKVLLNPKYMYVELYNLYVQIIYMPVDKHFLDVDIKIFIKNVISRIRFADMKCASYIDSLLSYLDNEITFSLKTFYDFVLSFEDKKIIENSSNKRLSDSVQLRHNQEYPYLIRLSTNEIISIDRPFFDIGKSNDSHYRLVNNPKISRKHCTLKLSDDDCYLMDNGSTNHTFINGELIKPGYDILLNNNDYIQMADEEFKFVSH